MNFTELFGVFSKRTAQSVETPRPLTRTFRNRVFMRCRDLFAHDAEEFWDEIQRRLAYFHGRVRLTEVHTNSLAEDALEFLLDCDDKHFLDFVEYIFHTKAYFHAQGKGSLIANLNEFFRQDDLPYAVTDFVWTTGQSFVYGVERETTTLTGYPQVIRKDSELLFQTAIQPALVLLRHADFSAGNKEFLEALEDYKKGDHGDCLTKRGSALESVLKVLCARHNWPHAQTDTAAPLLKTVIAKSGLETFFEQPIVQIATLRNKLSKAHGAGVGSRYVSEAKAEYAINMTAAAIILLVKEAK